MGTGTGTLDTAFVWISATVGDEGLVYYSGKRCIKLAKTATSSAELDSGAGNPVVMGLNPIWFMEIFSALEFFLWASC